MRYLDMLSRRGIRASIRPDSVLWLDPRHLVAPEIADMVRSHKNDILVEIRNCAADTSDDLREIVPDYHILWVATDLDSFEEFDPRYGYELDCSPVYRMLDASYYAWLRHRMENAKMAYSAGRMDDGSFEVLRTRFNAVHTWAVEHIGEDALRQAMRTTNVKCYAAPSEATYAAYRRTWDVAWSAFRGKTVAHGNPGCSVDTAVLPSANGFGGTRNTISAEARAKVDGIRDKAMALGWTEEGLYGNNGKHPFPYCDGYGVVMFVKRNCEIGEVTAEAIEIIQKHERDDGTVAYTSLRHYNQHVRQPRRTISGQRERLNRG